MRVWLAGLTLLLVTGCSSAPPGGGPDTTSINAFIVSIFPTLLIFAGLFIHYWIKSKTGDHDE